MKTFQKRNDPFQCHFCKKEVLSASQTSRNHCNFCLHSLHVDEHIPGDRMSSCHGDMAPSGIFFNGKKSIYQIEFTCTSCGNTHRNKIAEDDNIDLVSTLMLMSNKRQAQSKRK